MKKFILFISLLLLTACNEQSKTTIDTSHATHKTLDENKKLWNKTNTQNYSFVVRRSCFCPYEEKRQISVKNGNIIEAKYIPSNTPLPDNIKVKKIEDYFNIIQDALDTNAYEIIVTYDKTYGFPTTISIDYDQLMADEEIYYALTHFNQTLESGGIVCTEEYAPVCGKVDIQCVTTPCETIEKTFSNKCHLNANPNATYLRDGEC